MLINWIEKLSCSELNLNLGGECFCKDFLLRQHLKLLRSAFVEADFREMEQKKSRRTENVGNSRFHSEIKQSRATFIRNLGEIHWKLVFNLIMRRKIFSQKISSRRPPGNGEFSQLSCENGKVSRRVLRTTASLPRSERKLDGKLKLYGFYVEMGNDKRTDDVFAGILKSFLLPSTSTRAGIALFNSAFTFSFLVSLHVVSHDTVAQLSKSLISSSPFKRTFLPLSQEPPFLRRKFLCSSLRNFSRRCCTSQAQILRPLF